MTHSLFLSPSPSLPAGRTHNTNYALYHIGQPATAGVKQFAETGKTELLDSNAGEQQQQQMQAQAQAQKSATTMPAESTTERSVFDEFIMPAIQLGAGRSEAKVFVDSNHSLVSLMTRIVPSPDWFIGVDSFEVTGKGVGVKFKQKSIAMCILSCSFALAARGLTLSPLNWIHLMRAPTTGSPSPHPIGQRHRRVSFIA